MADQEEPRVLGRASVTIDGVNKGTFELYAPALQSHTASFLSRAEARTRFRYDTILGTKRVASGDFKVAVDGFTVGTTTTQENSEQILYNAWRGRTGTTASGGSYRVTGGAGHSASFKFNGTSIDWITFMGPAWGKARVSIDGIVQGTVDLYATTVRPQTVKTYGGLPPGAHAITVNVLEGRTRLPAPPI